MRVGLRDWKFWVVKEPFGIVSTGGESVSSKPSSLKGGLGFLVLHSAECAPDPLP